MQSDGKSRIHGVYVDVQIYILHQNYLKYLYAAFNSSAFFKSWTFKDVSAESGLMKLSPDVLFTMYM